MTDSCPNCCHRGCQPVGSRWRGDSVAHGYRCPSCGHQWAAVRYLPAYSELHRRRQQERAAA